jgi:DNA primase
VVLVEGYTDVIALHQAGVPEVVAQMGTALTEAQITAVAKLAPKALFCQDPDRAGQESVARGIAALRGVNSERTTRGVEFRIVRLPAGQDPADVVLSSGAEPMRALLDEAVPIERFEVERALEQQGASTDEMLSAATAVIGPMAPSVLRQELVKLVADRLGLGEQLVNDALRGRQPAVAPPWERRDHGSWRGGRDGARRGGGRDRFRDAPPSQPPEPVDPRTALTRREQSEAAFLAYCLALPDEGERRLAEVDLDDYFSAPTTRTAAAYLRGRLRTPTANLPAGDDEFARLIAELVVRSGALEATPAKLELEALQLDLHRLERHISSARLTGATGVTALAAERQKVLDEIRHRLL